MGCFRLASLEGCYLCQIVSFSDEICELMRKHLTSVCHGSSRCKLPLSHYRYTQTLDELIIRIEQKDQNGQKGIIGELLAHVIIRHCLPQFRVISPLFNSEDRGHRKGFDLVLSSNDGKDIWLTEVKSGDVEFDPDPSNKMNLLLKRAKTSLSHQLNDYQRSLWINAINGAQAAIQSSSDEVEAITSLIDNMQIDAQQGSFSDKDANALLTAVLYAPVESRVSIEGLKTNRDEIEGSFKNVFALGIQKQTYTTVLNFLKQERDSNE